MQARADCACEKDAVPHLFGVTHAVLKWRIAVVLWRVAPDHVIRVSDHFELRAVLSLAERVLEF